jgi:hypothetical protein
MFKKYIQQNNKLSTLQDNTHNSNNQKRINEHSFYRRIQNLTNIHFLYDENKLLVNGLQYTLHFNHKQWIFFLQSRYTPWRRLGGEEV